MDEYYSIKASVPWRQKSQPDPYTSLAASIIKSAVEDYIRVLKSQIKAGGNERKAEALAGERAVLERFFNSEHYALYSALLENDIDKDVLMKQCMLRAREQVKKETSKKTGKQ